MEAKNGHKLCLYLKTQQCKNGATQKLTSVNGPKCVGSQILEETITQTTNYSQGHSA